MLKRDPAYVSTSVFLTEAREMVGDLFHPNPYIYWADMLVTLAVATASTVIFLFAPLLSWPQIIGFFIAPFALHRLANFIHEVAHFRTNKQMRSFIIGWDLLVGVMTMMPSFFFDTHMLHHNGNVFGTKHDCEYVPLGRGSFGTLTMFMGQIFLQPIMVIIRFTILAPISFLHPRLRQWVLENCSSFVFVWPCPRELPANAPRLEWAIMDILCWLRATSMFVAIPLGILPWHHILLVYIIAAATLFLHYFRSLAAHIYLGDGRKMEFLDQVNDSIDITGDPVFTELLFPVGLRYHALHHLFPSIPYHNLGTAHRRLMEQLPDDSFYRLLVYSSFWDVLKQLIHNINQPPVNAPALSGQNH
jgi:fatty acid desaturase